MFTSKYPNTKSTAPFACCNPLYFSSLWSGDAYFLQWTGSSFLIKIKEVFAKHREVFNIRRTLVGNKIVDHSDVVGASPVGAAPTTSSFSTEHLASMDWAKTTAWRDEKHLCFEIGCALYQRIDGNRRLKWRLGNGGRFLQARVLVQG